MRGVIVGITLAAGVAGAAASAAAQPSTAPAEPATDAYPAEHAERPLLLPVAGIESTATLEILDISYDDSSGVDGYELYSLRPAARYGLNNAEVEAGMTLGLNEPENVSGADTLQSIDLAARLGVGESSTAGAELRVGNPTSDYGSFFAAAAVATRQRYGAASLDLGASAGYTFSSGETTLDTINLRGRIAATAQLAPVFALQARGELYWYDFTGSSDPTFPSLGWYIGQQYGVAALFAATPALDLVAGFDVLSTSGNDVKLFTLGVAARRLP
jgi:hypothetical protein